MRTPPDGTYPAEVLHLACLDPRCDIESDGAPVFHSLRALFLHLHRMHPRALPREEER